MLRSPVVRFGGKSRVASIVWERFGDVPNFVSPFFGSGGVELARPHAPRVETFGDADCMIANFFRAVTADPESVARHADWPANEADLVARRKYILERRPAVREACLADPRYYDAEIAGWWVHGVSCAIADSFDRSGETCMPDVPATRGVNRRALKGRAKHSASEGCGFSTVVEWLCAIRDRLRGATFICGPWERITGATVMGLVPSARATGMSPTAAFFDPPYPGHEDVYVEGESVFADVASWCAEHGDRPEIRICLCGYEGTWSPPPGWEEVRWSAKGGYGGQRKDGVNENSHRERLWFSPHCLKPARQGLWANFAEA